MIITKEQFEQDILTLAKFIGQEKTYNVFIETHVPELPRIVEMIAYELFLIQFDYRYCSEELYDSYRNLLDYSIELRNNGFLNFK
jgi:hypothetical protein